jgi:hypothetical protein
MLFAFYIRSAILRRRFGTDAQARWLRSIASKFIRLSCNHSKPAVSFKRWKKEWIQGAEAVFGIPPDGLVMCVSERPGFAAILETNLATSLAAKLSQICNPLLLVCDELRWVCQTFIRDYRVWKIKFSACNHGVVGSNPHSIEPIISWHACIGMGGIELQTFCL